MGTSVSPWMEDGEALPGEERRERGHGGGGDRADRSERGERGGGDRHGERSDRARGGGDRHGRGGGGGGGDGDEAAHKKSKRAGGERQGLTLVHVRAQLEQVHDTLIC